MLTLGVQQEGFKLYNNSFTSGSKLVQGYYNTFQKYNIKAKFGIDECWCEVDGNKVHFTPNASINDNNFTLFIANGMTGAANWRIYKTIIYDSNGNMVRDFRPCIYNGEVGMWDDIEGRFYGNQGTGEFVGGPSLQRIVLDGSSISTAEATSISLLRLDDEDLLFNTDYTDEELNEMDGE